MARVIKYTKAFKKQFKKRSPWKYIIQCLIEDKTTPDYFYLHTLEGVTMEKQETTRKKKSLI